MNELMNVLNIIVVDQLIDCLFAGLLFLSDIE